jgi:hypothetical protein
MVALKTGRAKICLLLWLLRIIIYKRLRRQGLHSCFPQRTERLFSQFSATIPFPVATMLSKSLFLGVSTLLGLAEGAVLLEERAAKGCNADNVLRALLRFSTDAVPFCSSYINIPVVSVTVTDSATDTQTVCTPYSLDPSITKLFQGHDHYPDYCVRDFNFSVGVLSGTNLSSC